MPSLRRYPSMWSNDRFSIISTTMWRILRSDPMSAMASPPGRSSRPGACLAPPARRSRGEPTAPRPSLYSGHGGTADERDLSAGSGQAVRPGDGGERPRPGGAGRDLLRAARAERRGQVDDDADADRAGPRRPGGDPRDGARAAGGLEA